MPMQIVLNLISFYLEAIKKIKNMTNSLINLINDLRRLPAETEWCEFKLNYETPERIGEYIYIYLLLQTQHAYIR